MTDQPKVVINVEVTGSMKCQNGTTVTVTKDAVILEREGPRGGQGSRITLTLREWDAVNDGVSNLRQALHKAGEYVTSS